MTAPSLGTSEAKTRTEIKGAEEKPVQGKQANNAWGVLTLLVLANLLNLYDRTIPGMLNESVRIEFGLRDYQLGLISTAFTLVYGVFGLPLGRLADTRSRKTIMALGLALWSVFTGLSGLASNFWTYLATRMAVGVGEASFGPASMSMIGDLFPAQKRGRALSIYWLGLPLGVILASLTVGLVVRVTGNWHATFFVAMVPGLVLSGFMFLIREPERGGAEAVRIDRLPVDRPLRRLLRIPTFWLITLAGVTINFSSQTASAFLTPLLQRYFGMPLGTAAIFGGAVLAVSGLVGFLGGGLVADQIYKRSERGRLTFGAASLVLSAVMTYFALDMGRESSALFLVVFTSGWILQYQFFTTAFPAIQDVVQPRMRAVALASFYVAIYLIGGTIGPALVGALSDHFAQAAMTAAGASEMTTQFRGFGLHGAMYLIPIVLLLTGAALFAASLTFCKDAEVMRCSIAGRAAAPGNIA